MYSKTQLVFKYLRYYLAAKNGKGHGMHSPFVFDFITNVLNDERSFYAYEQIEAVRNELLHDEKLLTIEDFGAGSRVNKTNQRSVAAIAASSLKPKKYGQLLFRMVDHYQPAHVLELGTSLGITTAYLAAANPAAKVTTMEGAAEVATAAQKNFEQLQLHNIRLVLGDFEKTLSTALQSIPTVDFAFIDGNHRYEPTVKYFRQILEKANDKSIIILDDIHWSEEMERAWREVQQHDAVMLTIDLFFIGIVLLRKEFKVKQHFAVRF
ncbi:MAG: class I SAM-dependent methyltransferase [Bacteroidota bacterium]|nr:class I SAM-dependent methyltransferase [Bacteroidota bacterium]